MPIGVGVKPKVILRGVSPAETPSIYRGDRR